MSCPRCGQDEDHERLAEISLDDPASPERAMGWMIVCRLGFLADQMAMVNANLVRLAASLDSALRPMVTMEPIRIPAAGSKSPNNRPENRG